MELLLDLIRSAQLEITELSLTQITEDYLNRLTELKRLDIAVSVDFLVMGATLALYKTRALLGEPAEVEAADAYKEALVQQLLKYEQYKQAAMRLEQFLEQTPAVTLEKVSLTARLPATAKAYPVEQHGQWQPASLADLAAAFYRIMDRQTQTLAKDSFSKFAEKVEEKRLWIVSELKGARGMKGVPFSYFVKAASGNAPLPSEVLAVFVALLELYKLAQLEAYQAEAFAEIMLFNNAARARSTPAETKSTAATEVKHVDTADEQADH